jgi:CAAX prenyl protease-like protein
MTTPHGGGWWAYWTPYFGFLLVAQFDDATPYMWVARVAVPLAALLYFARLKSYPELAGYRPNVAKTALDVAVGVIGAALWVAPFLVFASLRPVPETAFDPNLLGPSRVWLTLAMRLTGFVLVTPFMEELFIRSWLLRSVDTLSDAKIGFRDVPMARFTVRSFVVVVLWFTLSHARWEWPVAAAWIVMTQLWFYHRKHILSVVVAHAASNLSIFLFVLLADERLRDPDGNPISLWFFL